MGGAILSRSLIQFSVNGLNYDLALFGLRPNYGRDNGDLLKKDLSQDCCIQCPLIPWQVTVNPCLCQRLLDTHRQVWLSLLWDHCSFLLGPGVHKILFVPSKSLFPQSCGSSVIKYCWPSKSNSLGILSPFAGFSGWEICFGP